MSLGEALRLADADAARAAPFRARTGGSARAARRPYPFEQPPLRTDPITVEEILVQKAANLARLKRKAAREERRLREVYAQQDAEGASVREAQDERDRAWAEGKR